MAAPLVTGVSPKEGPPGSRVTIRGENFGKDPKDLIGELLFLEMSNGHNLHSYTPRKLCLWVGILFSRCPSVRPFVCNVLFP